MGKRGAELRRIGFSEADGIEFAEGADRTARLVRLATAFGTPFRPRWPTRRRRRAPRCVAISWSAPATVAAAEPLKNPAGRASEVV
jgi:hypothetical protein